LVRPVIVPANSFTTGVGFVRFAKWMRFRTLCAPFALSTTGCGDDKAGPMATDDELAEYGKKAAAGGPLEGMTMKDGAKAKE
jgi:hypothetical protein